MTKSKAYDRGRKYGAVWADQADQETLKLLDGIDWPRAERAGAWTWETIKGALGERLQPEQAPDDGELDVWAEGFLQGVTEARQSAEGGLPDAY